MQADISYYASERNTYMNLLKQYYLNDTTEIGIQQYISLLENENDIESKYELVFAKISNQDYEGALLTLTAIGTMIDNELQPEEADRHAKMTNLIPVLITIESTHPKWEELSDNDRNLLINLSETDNTVTGSLATACRMVLDTGFVYAEPIYIATDRPLKMASPKKGKTAIANEQQIKISPNPATDYIAIECNTEGVGNNLRLQITDAMGKIVLEKEFGKTQQIIDIREFAKGSYYCTVYNNGKAFDTVKFIKK
jgi:hypothetical protein